MKDLAATLERESEEGLRRELREGGAGTELDRDGRRLINLASNDSLGLATDPHVIAATHEGATRWGAGATASRLVSGNHSVHRALENDLAAMRGTEAALVFSSGYAANVGVLSSVCGRGDIVLADELVHASLLDGIRLSGAKLRRYRHAEVAHVAKLLATAGTGTERFIVTEGVFSMDADLPDVAALAALAYEHDATLIVDDAHGGGTVGPDGRGALAEAGATAPIVTGTLSKAYGAQGGYVAGSRSLIEYLINHARSFIFSTGLSPAIASAAREGLRRATEDSWRRDALRSHVAQLRGAATQAGLEVLGDPRAPMVPAVVGDPTDALALSEQLAELGVLAPAIRPPAVPTSRIRFAPMATHTQEQIDRACAAILEAVR